MPGKNGSDGVAALRKTAVQTGRALAAAGQFMWKQAGDVVRLVDPDLALHFLQMPLMAYSMADRKQRAVERGEPDGHPPLILVHGLGGSAGDFLLFALYLRVAGRKRSYRIDCGSEKHIPEKAARLAAFIREVKQVTGEPKVDIIGHSLGGLIARMAVLDHRLAGSVNTIITMGTPHHGTHAARYANAKITRELRPDSPLLHKLNAKPWPKSVRLVSAWSRNDVFVLPVESAIAPGAQAFEMTPFTHLSYLVDPRGWPSIFQLLSGRDVGEVRWNGVGVTPVAAKMKPAKRGQKRNAKPQRRKAAKPRQVGPESKVG